MRIPLVAALGLTAFCLATGLQAEQQVTLQSGAKLTGVVSMEGADLVVDVAGAQIKVPFKDVASVTSAQAGDSDNASMLLLKALEARALAPGKRDDFGLFAEAFRLAPEDPHVAFWYARSLVAAGYGKGAHDVFAPRKEAIAAAFPGAVDRLQDQITARLELEKLPSALVQRIDQIAESAALVDSITAESLSYYGYFRLVDQNDEPIEKSAFRVHCHGENENLESYADGYHLFTYAQRRNFGNNACRLEVAQPGLLSETFEFQGSPRGAKCVGNFQVKRLTDADRREVVVRVVDPDGKPLPGATVGFTPVSQFGRSEGIRPATTAAEGDAKLTLYPNNYQCQVSLKDFNSVSRMVVVAADGAPQDQIEFKLYSAIRATIRVVWRARMINQPGMPQFGNEAVMTGEFEQQAGGAAPVFRGGPFGPHCIRLVQTEDDMQLQFTEHMRFPNAAGASWVGRLESHESESSEDAKQAFDVKVAAELFNVLGLTELDSIVEEFKIKRTNLGMMPGAGGPVSLPVEAGDIFVGRMQSHDPQTGRPALVEFKILATELSRL